MTTTATAQEVLRSHGFRNTPQRLHVLAAVQHLRHATPEQIHTYLAAHDDTLNLSTVYRVLEVLEEVDLVRHTHIESGATTYHATDGPPHIHLRCRECGTVTSLPSQTADAFTAEVMARVGFDADLTHASIHGVCSQCRGKV